jgi:hypothetical protein
MSTLPQHRTWIIDMLRDTIPDLDSMITSPTRVMHHIQEMCRHDQLKSPQAHIVMLLSLAPMRTLTVELLHAFFGKRSTSRVNSRKQIHDSYYSPLSYSSFMYQTNPNETTLCIISWLFAMVECIDIDTQPDLLEVIPDITGEELEAVLRACNPDEWERLYQNKFTRAGGVNLIMTRGAGKSVASMQRITTVTRFGTFLGKDAPGRDRGASSKRYTMFLSTDKNKSKVYLGATYGRSIEEYAEVYGVSVKRLLPLVPGERPTMAQMQRIMHYLKITLPNIPHDPIELLSTIVERHPGALDRRHVEIALLTAMHPLRTLTSEMLRACFRSSPTHIFMRRGCTIEEHGMMAVNLTTKENLNPIQCDLCNHSQADDTAMLAWLVGMVECIEMNTSAELRESIGHFVSESRVESVLRDCNPAEWRRIYGVVDGTVKAPETEPFKLVVPYKKGWKTQTIVDTLLRLKDDVKPGSIKFQELPR